MLPLLLVLLAVGALAVCPPSPSAFNFSLALSLPASSTERAAVLNAIQMALGSTEAIAALQGDTLTLLPSIVGDGCDVCSGSACFSASASAALTEIAARRSVV